MMSTKQKKIEFGYVAYAKECKRSDQNTCGSGSSDKGWKKMVKQDKEKRIYSGFRRDKRLLLQMVSKYLKTVWLWLNLSPVSRQESLKIMMNKNSTRVYRYGDISCVVAALVNLKTVCHVLSDYFSRRIYI